MIAIISLNIPAEKRGSILHDLSADEPGVCRRTYYGVSSRTQRKVRDVFLVSAVWSFIALLIFAANVGRTREKDAA